MNAKPVELPQELFLDMNRAGPIPIYFQLATTIENAIAGGLLPPGARLENEVALGERLGISRPTVRRAIQAVVDKGLLVRRRGIGTQVVQHPVTRNVELTSLYDDLQRDAKIPSTEVLLREIIPAGPEIAGQLSVESGSMILHLRRRRLADGTPLSVLENFLPFEVVDVSEAELTARGLYQLMRSRGIQISVAQQRIGARMATTDESHLLDIASHGPVLTMERTAFDNNGRPVEVGRHCYRPDLYSFQVTLVHK